jgi:hypothetical protein
VTGVQTCALPISGEVYYEPKPGYNFNGDKSMVNVIINAKFGNEGPQQTV